MKTGFRDPWALLGVGRDASDREIKAAYRKMALECHPDKAQDPESANRFTDISLAYQAISSIKKRSAWISENEPLGTHQNSNGKTAESVKKVIEITFAESFSGTKKEVELEVEQVCSNCGGSGAAPGFKPIVCDTCQGSGSHSIGSSSNICQACEGRGFLIEKPCQSCRSGVVVKKRKFVFQIPPGVTQGHQIKINSNDSHGSSAILSVLIEESKVFKRNLNDPADLMIEVPVSYPEAVLGSSVKIPTPTHVVSLKIPPRTQSGKVFRIKGEGMPKPHSNEKGSLYARVSIHVPDSPSREELESIASMQKYQPKDLRYHLFDS